MTIYDPAPRAWSAPSPAVCLALVLAASAALAVLPQRAAQRLRQAAQAGLRPGLLLAASTRGAAEHSLALLGNFGSGAGRAAQRERELNQLRDRSAQLEAEIVWLRSQLAASAEAGDLQSLLDAPLVRPRLLAARVLGRQAQSFLARQGLLDAGSQAGISAGDLVLDGPRAIVDQGTAAGAASGQLVVAGRRVWGKVGHAQPRFSTVLRATDAGYRDLVRILQPSGAGLVPGPRAVLEGTGQPLCRLRLVPVTQAVAAGQVVVAEGGEGFVEGALVYGHIERVEQTPGAAHWDLWVRPAMPPDPPHTVVVLTAELATAGWTPREATR